LFADYAKTIPDKFTNVTNGIAHRRWLCQANPALCAFLTELIGPAFLKDADGSMT
jgi:starch phosphorylase